MHNWGFLAGIAFLYALSLPGPAPAQEEQGLRISFRARSFDFRLTAKDLQNAYEVTPSGDIRMQPFPNETVVADERVQISLHEAQGSLGRVSVRRSENTHEILLRPDNGLGGPTILTGLPFGYQYLPSSGRARAGETWRQDFPAPGSGGALRVAAAYKYTLRGRRPLADCPDCVEVQITGLRRFVGGPALDRALRRIRLNQTDSFFTEDQAFALGSVLFSPGEGFFRRFELNANTSMFTVLPVPGMMRQVVLDRAPAQ